MEIKITSISIELKKSPSEKREYFPGITVIQFEKDTFPLYSAKIGTHKSFLGDENKSFIVMNDKEIPVIITEVE